MIECNAAAGGQLSSGLDSMDAERKGSMPGAAAKHPPMEARWAGSQVSEAHCGFLGFVTRRPFLCNCERFMEARTNGSLRN